ncbi:MAG: 5-dehydro-4-deoxy-D-glucuronate isomerase [Cellvibrionaceae bacterium]|nr:5-dehydro-4-deoxy-D-glucuronate isomerase [Cellvibrionaceae bacterium]
MTTTADERFAVHIDDYKHYDTEKLRKHFLVSDLFIADEFKFTYTHYDRIMVGGVQPVQAPMKLESVEQLKADYFLQRRELGAINVGGPGTVSVDGETFELSYKEALYVGRDSKNVVFASNDAATPAKFYLLSTPAHAAYPSVKVGQDQAEVIQLGTMETCNQRTLNKLIVNSIVKTCQLQMGMTALKPGSVWNTMPPHTHSRRMEVYFYFEVPEDHAVCHFMGPKEETRHLWMTNEQAVVSPPWSMHCAAATSNYIFIWGMAGENLDYDDMDRYSPSELK